MKKEYINPEMEVFEIAIRQQLLAGSENLGIDPSDVDPSGSDAPPFMPDLGPSIPSGPSFGPSFPFGL